jgi:polynucleotide 5'-hydroxyl-kinase GRC3/NOL9
MARLELKAGDVYRVEGLISLEVVDGEVSVVGGVRKKGDRITIPRAKSIPLEAETDAVVEYTVGAGGTLEKLPGRTIPPDWDAFLKEVVETRPKTVLVIGSVDVGKTFLTTYFGNRLLASGVRMAAVDSDVGQADIGPPTTMGLGVFERPVAQLYEVPLRSLYFVGSMSPSGHMLEFIVGMKWLVERGLRHADLVLVNTPGWVAGGAGRSLQLYTAELVNPDYIVALQRQAELEHLLRCLPSQKIRKLTVSAKVRKRDPSERAELRALLLGKYFENAKRVVLNLARVRFERTYLFTGTPLDPAKFGEDIVYAERVPEFTILVSRRRVDPEYLERLSARHGPVKVIQQGQERNVIVGLASDENEVLGIGIVEKIDFTRRQLVVRTPVDDVESIRAVQFGSMKITPQGREIGTVRPGTF